MIETKRLLLREYTPDDFNALYEILSDPEDGKRGDFWMLKNARKKDLATLEKVGFKPQERIQVQ